MTAFTNLGITTGVTPTLSLVGKLCIIASMIVGRIGSFTLVLALKLRSKKDITEISYPEERVMIG
jgi:trk system potassium uptake protein TrkH